MKNILAWQKSQQQPSHRKCRDQCLIPDTYTYTGGSLASHACPDQSKRKINSTNIFTCKTGAILLEKVSLSFSSLHPFQGTVKRKLKKPCHSMILMGDTKVDICGEAIWAVRCLLSKLLNWWYFLSTPSSTQVLRLQ